MSESVRVAAILVIDDPTRGTTIGGIQMAYDFTRTRAIQLWFFLVALVAVIWIMLGPALSPGSVAVLVALSLVPAAIVMMLWPRAQPPTAAEVIRGSRNS